MNIYDISKAAGVSIASVSRVINGADNVSKKTRQKVLDAIEKYGYTPNAYARGLGRGSMKTIGIMCSDSSDIYLANAIYYLESSLRSHGYHSILCCTGYDLKNKMASFELLRSRQVDAVIMAGSKYVELEEKKNRYIIEGAREHPVMLINGCIDAPNIYSTLCDDRGGMRDAVKRLYADGRRKLLYVYSSESYSGRNKLQGIREGCEACGLSGDGLRILKGEKDFQKISSLLAAEYQKAPFDAVIASSDTSGVGAVKFALRAGLRIPEELAIISFNNSVLAQSTAPELTSVDSRLKKLCETTVHSLMQLLSEAPLSEAGSTAVPRKTVIRSRLVERQTTAFSKKEAGRASHEVFPRLPG